MKLHFFDCFYVYVVIKNCEFNRGLIRGCRISTHEL